LFVHCRHLCMGLLPNSAYLEVKVFNFLNTQTDKPLVRQKLYWIEVHDQTQKRETGFDLVNRTYRRG